MTYQPVYTIREHDYKGASIAPFILMPDGTVWNVWDIPKAQYTDSVENAIKHAFELGLMAANMQHHQILDSKFSSYKF
jgi:hypothetical protein